MISLLCTPPCQPRPTPSGPTRCLLLPAYYSSVSREASELSSSPAACLQLRWVRRPSRALQQLRYGHTQLLLLLLVNSTGGDGVSGGVGSCRGGAPPLLHPRGFRFLRVPVGPADGAAAEGDRLLVRAGRGLHVHPLQRRLLQPKHRGLPLLLGGQQLLPEVQGLRRHLRLRRRRHPLLLRPQFLWMHFPFQCQCCWDNWHYHDDRHLEPWSRHRNRHQWHRDGEHLEPAGHEQLRWRGSRLVPEG